MSSSRIVTYPLRSIQYSLLHHHSPNISSYSPRRIPLHSNYWTPPNKPRRIEGSVESQISNIVKVFLNPVCLFLTQLERGSWWEKRRTESSWVNSSGWSERAIRSNEALPTLLRMARGAGEARGRERGSWGDVDYALTSIGEERIGESYHLVRSGEHLVVVVRTWEASLRVLKWRVESRREEVPKLFRKSKLWNFLSLAIRSTSRAQTVVAQSKVE